MSEDKALVLETVTEKVRKRLAPRRDHGSGSRSLSRSGMVSEDASTRKVVPHDEVVKTFAAWVSKKKGLDGSGE